MVSRSRFIFLADSEMFIGVDFDNTICDQDRPYDDLITPLKMLPGARYGLEALKRAGHFLVLISARNNLALREDPKLDPLVRAGLRKPAPDLELNQARWEQMLDFVEDELPGIFSAIDDGKCGKYSVDLMVDDRALRIGRGHQAMTWKQIAHLYGQPGEELIKHE